MSEDEAVLWQGTPDPKQAALISSVMIAIVLALIGSLYFVSKSTNYCFMFEDGVCEKFGGRRNGIGFVAFILIVFVTVLTIRLLRQLFGTPAETLFIFQDRIRIVSAWPLPRVVEMPRSFLRYKLAARSIEFEGLGPKRFHFGPLRKHDVDPFLDALARWTAQND